MKSNRKSYKTNSVSLCVGNLGLIELLYNSKLILPKTVKQSKEILSLPINQYLSKKEIKYISENINRFYNSWKY